MKVALLTPAYGRQGIIGHHVEALADGIVDAGGTVEVFVGGGVNRPLGAEHAGLRIAHFPGSPLRRGQTALSWEIRQRAAEFDVLHAHGEALLPAALAARGANVPLIFTPHHYASAQSHLRQLVQGRHRGLARQALFSADRVLCVSTSEALEVARYAPQANVEIIPNGIDGAAIVAARPFPSDGRVILTVDRLTKWAGIHRVISALPALAPSYRVVVVGGGRGRRALESHADYLRVSDRVEFIGTVGDPVLYRLLRTASVVATLKEESLWAVTLMYALAAGTPVVASDILAHREAATIVAQQGVSFVSRRASPFVIADAIRTQAGNGSRPRPELVPSWETMVERVLPLYEEALAGVR